MGNNFDIYTAAGNDQTKLPWFLRVLKTQAYHLQYSGGVVSYPSALEFENPLVSFGSNGGGTSLYTGQSYRFGIASGGQVNDGSGKLEFDVYKASDFNAGATNVQPHSQILWNLPIPGMSNWSTFENNGYQTEMASLIDPVSGENIPISVKIKYDPEFYDSEYWLQSVESPIVITVTANSADYYLIIRYYGACSVLAGSNYNEYYAAVKDPTNVNPYASVTYSGNSYTVSNPNPSSNSFASVNFALDFQDRKSWESVYVDEPHFAGIPLPSQYQGKTIEELLDITPPVISNFQRERMANIRE
ncbi:MAG: hypothetical protein QM796_13120 [Chthoniobacteraceae bacterium]